MYQPFGGGQPSSWSEGVEKLKSRLNMEFAMGVATIAALATAIGAAPIAPAMAEVRTSDTVATENALDALGLLAAPSLGRSVDLSAPTGALDSNRGLVVGSGDGEVTVRPLTDGPATLSPSGKSLVYSSSTSHSIALTGKTTAADAGYVVINDASAPEDYAFNLATDGIPAVLELVEDRVLVKDAAGDVVNVISPAWAVDSSGRSISTTYSVAGSVLTQHVDHAGAEYPVA
ncbi:hypothetical protein ACFVWR_03045 [Leifsonia sp. NPDC058292]|uniref:hypothetical protein n=1 Tax=Leifsonia sp. NPDC058292 TaxID=3346428 RepID=UPI0036D839BB